MYITIKNIYKVYDYIFSSTYLFNELKIRLLKLFFNKTYHFNYYNIMIFYFTFNNI